MAVAGIKVKGDRELERAFRQLRREVVAELRPALRKATEPVRADAQKHASAEITNIGTQWPQMRIGVTTKLVYVAPKMKRHGGSPRPNLGGLLLDKMEAALKEHEDELVHSLELVVAISAKRAGFTYI